MQAGIIILSTYPNEKIAAKISKKIVQSKLAACVSLTKVRSFYWWHNKVEDSEECLAIYKSVMGADKELKKAIVKSHPYKVPEIVELKMNSVSKGYLDWMTESINLS
ncbi:MAG: divalent-cation tolerance protein CutA [Nitrososphaerales archaeon]